MAKHSTLTVRFPYGVLAIAFGLCLQPEDSFALVSRVIAHQQIDDGVPGNMAFGTALAKIGDLDDDGVTDIAVGSHEHDGGDARGAVWIVFLNADGTVKARQKISDISGGFGGTLANNDEFGRAVAGLGDLDGDSVEDIAAGSKDLGDGGAGAVWILFLNSDGTVKGHQKINATNGGFTGAIEAVDFFGAGLAALGDLDSDGVVDLAAGAARDDEGHTDAGAVWILFLDTDGTVKSSGKIANGTGGLAGVLQDDNFFGTSIANLGDVDADGIVDIAVGAPESDSGGTPLDGDIGEVWVLFLDTDGSVKAEQRIGAIAGGFDHQGYLGSLGGGHDLFGQAVTGLGDVDGDDVPDLMVGAPGIDSGRSRLWTLLLNRDGTVRHEQNTHLIDSSMDGLIGCCGLFGWALAAIGDLDGDGFVDTVAGDPSLHQAWVQFHDAPVPYRCAAGPSAGCIGGGKASINIGARPDDRDFLKWKLKNGDAFSQIDLDDPRNTTAYTVCLYDYVAGTPTPASEMILTATRKNWIDKSPKGFDYADKRVRMSGVRQLKLRPGDATSSSVQARAFGKYFPTPQAVAPDRMLEADPQVLIQLVGSDGFCVESAIANVRANDATRFKATNP